MNETIDATAIFAPLWKRKWVILGVGVVVAAIAYLYYKHETPLYTASTQVYLGASAEEQAPGEKAISAKNAALSGQGQAQVINAIVVEQVRRQLRGEGKKSLSHGTKVRAKAPEKSEFITITTEAHSAVGAALFANLVAQTYVKRSRSNRQRSIETAIAIARRQLRRIEAANAPPPPGSTSSKGKKGVSSSSVLQSANLSTKINQLESSLAVTGAQQIKPAKAASAELVSPKPRKDGIFGFVIGVVLASIAAYLASRFDRRLRSLASIEGVFGVQILTALPKVKRPVIQEGTPRPSKLLLEPLRRLHTVLQLGERGEVDASPAGKVILFISPDPGDGKSTLVADLALVQRDAGERVAIVEANFRRPVQTRLLGLDGSHGLADVLTGKISFEEALQRVSPALAPDAVDTDEEGGEAVATAVGARAGALFVLAGGGAVTNPPALIADPAMPELLGSLAGEYDYVLIDAPSPLEFSDVMPLLGEVGGVVVVARSGHTREVAAQRLVKMMGGVACAPVIGVTANCAPRADSEQYGFSAPNGRAWPSKLIGR